MEPAKTEFCANQMRAKQDCPDFRSFFSEQSTREAANFFAEFSGITPTPLHNLAGLAKTLGLGNLYIKDESVFPQLNAFKIRGCAWAVANLAGGNVHSGAHIKSSAFVTATDGNHGASLAYAAAAFGRRAIVFMPRGALPGRVAKIRSFGAECMVTDFNYDDAVRHAAQYARTNGHILVQDTAWTGYTDIPRLIMQGYGVMAHEILRQCQDIPPTHIFLQAGVGSFAGAMIAAFTEGYEARKIPLPLFISMEPKHAACVYKSISAADGNAHPVAGDLSTNMAGLACGVVNPIAWPVLRNFLDFSIACDDMLAVNGMRMLANPKENDPRIVSGESGAVGAGLIAHIMENPGLRSHLGIGRESSILLISTEGATDEEAWQHATGQHL